MKAFRGIFGMKTGVYTIYSSFIKALKGIPLCLQSILKILKYFKYKEMNIIIHTDCATSFII